MSLELVKRVKLEAGNSTEERVLAYLEENASDVLAEKISAGKKTLAGALAYCKGEARKKAVDGCACIDDATVFGWIIHFFEEDSIKEGAKPKPKTKTAGKAGGTPAVRRSKAAARADAVQKKPVGPIVLDLFSGEEVPAR
jgi:hypothetical protein